MRRSPTGPAATCSTSGAAPASTSPGSRATARSVRRGAASRPGRPARGGAVPRAAVGAGPSRSARDRPGAAAARRVGGRGRTPGGPTSSAPAASRGCASSTASCGGAGRRSSSTTTRPGRRSGGGSGAGYPQVDPEAVERFWAGQGWQRLPLDDAVAVRPPRGASRPWCASSSTRRPPTRCWPSTRAPPWTTPSTCGGAALRRRVAGLSVASPSLTSVAWRRPKTAKPRWHTGARSAGGRPGKWVGRCWECQAWGTVAEVGAPGARGAAGRSAPRPCRSARSTSRPHGPAPGIGELDRVLGGGIVPGAVLLLAGEPGVGKSTLLLEVAPGRRTAGPARCSSPARSRRLRSGCGPSGAARLPRSTSPPRPTWPPCSATSTGRARTGGRRLDPDHRPPRGRGSAGRRRAGTRGAAALIRVAKDRGISVVLVGHVTKDGSIAGPRVLEHLVDVVLYFEGERHARLRWCAP